MIILTKLNGMKFALNPDFIEAIEANPDTTVRLITKNIIIVQEPMDDVIKKIITYRTTVGSNSGANITSIINELG